MHIDPVHINKLLNIFRNTWDIHTFFLTILYDKYPWLRWNFRFFNQNTWSQSNTSWFRWYEMLGVIPLLWNPLRCVSITSLDLSWESVKQLLRKHDIRIDSTSSVYMYKHWKCVIVFVRALGLGRWALHVSHFRRQRDQQFWILNGRYSYST